MQGGVADGIMNLDEASATEDFAHKAEIWGPKLMRGILSYSDPGRVKATAFRPSRG